MLRAYEAIVEGVRYDFGEGTVWVVAVVQILSQGIWVKTHECEALFDKKSGRVLVLFSGGEYCAIDCNIGLLTKEINNG